MSEKLSWLVEQVKATQRGLRAFNNLEQLMKYVTVGNKPIADLIDTSDYNGTFTRLTDRLHIETDATMALGMARIMNGIAQNQKHLGLSDDALAYFHDNRPTVTVATDDYKKQLAIDTIEQGKGILSDITGGKSGEDLRNRIKAIKDYLLDPDLTAKFKELTLEINEESNKYIEADNEEDRQFYANVIEALKNRHSAIKSEHDIDVRDKRAELNKLNLELEEKGKQAIDKLLAVSPITHEQATEWVARQKTPKNVYSALAKKGYPTDKVKADMAEFYRLTHGKLKDVEIVLGGAKRANSKETSNILAGAVDLGSNPDKRVLFHELAHGLESDALAVNMARGFLIKRRKNDKAVSLNKLSTGHGYHSSEVAYEDDFINPYVGKIYQDVTEVFSMGVERLADPSKFMELVARDPEHAALILQYLGNESEVLNATKKLTSGVFNDISESNKKQANEYQTEIKRLAANITLVDDNPMGKFTNSDKWNIAANLRIRDAEFNKVQYVGSILQGYTYIHIISGSFPDSKSKRLKKAFAVIEAPIGERPEAYAVHRDLDGVKAVIYVAFSKGKVNRWGLYDSDALLIESNISKIKALA
jgi:hypothetical protein